MRTLRQDLLDQFLLAETGGSDHEQVKSLLLDIDREFDRLERTFLSERLCQ